METALNIVFTFYILLKPAYIYFQSLVGTTSANLSI